MNKFELTGRIVLLTGAAGHLGRAISRAILEAGADLIATGRQNESLLSLKNALPEVLRPRIHVLASDITEDEAPARIASEVRERFGRLHGVVNNAYAGRVGPLESIEAKDVWTACSYNIVAPFMLTKALLPLLETAARKDSRSSSVVNVASMYGSVSPDPAIYGDSGKNNPIHYGATKAGLIQMTRYLACHLGHRGVRVNSIAPGPFPDTESNAGISGFLDSLASKVPMRRIGHPEEVAGPVVFLLSDAASYVNGVNLPIDGGWTAW